jgi:hypothetical protein
VEPLLGQTADDEVEMPAVFKLLDATMGKDKISFFLSFKELVDQISFNLSLARNPGSSKWGGRPPPPGKNNKCKNKVNELLCVGFFFE